MKHVQDELNSFYYLRNSDLFLDNLNLIGLFKVTGHFFELYFVLKEISIIKSDIKIQVNLLNVKFEKKNWKVVSFLI